VTPQEAWASFEEAMLEIEDFDKAVKWAKAHPFIAKKLTPKTLVTDFLNQTDTLSQSKSV